MQQLSTFQIIVLGIFVALILIGVGVFAASGGFVSGTDVGKVTIWGTTDIDEMQAVLDTLRPADQAFQDVVYIEKDPATYTAELINAMAAGGGPDLFLVSLSQINSFSDKILTIPYSEVSQGSFINAFIDEGQLFLGPQGALALPFIVDPLVMYWNRDLFSSAGIANHPLYWNDFLSLAPKVSSLDGISAVKRSAVALGVWSNIANAKEILSNLFLQAGDRIISRDVEGKLVAVLGDRAQGATTDPASSALRFYTEFANPSKTSYSWNRSLPKSNDMFASGDLAVYFGFASELRIFAARNPNLRYSVALIPQIEGNGTRSTFARLTGLAIPRTSRNVIGALEVAK
ncbi:extracellular solute-binding protein, partial [Acetobacteraceae bacterium]|nr:extracellular solute-binding protein [Candidatus Parcubacteria bacterium]